MPGTMADDLRYVALGDSYTIGTSVEPSERFPDQLVAMLAGGGGRQVRLVANLGVNGYTTADLRGSVAFGPANLRLYVRNLFDERGQQSASTVLAAAGGPANVSTVRL